MSTSTILKLFAEDPGSCGKLKERHGARVIPGIVDLLTGIQNLFGFGMAGTVSGKGVQV